jgi:preprotein translocase subunit SecB
MTEQQNQAPAGEDPHFEILRIYLKDVSFETPNSPVVFLQPFKPEISLHLNTSINKLEGDTYEVVLNVTVTSKQGDKTGFLVEVQQAGIFNVRGYDKEQRGAMLGAYCPNTLYPYVREAISDLVVKGGFPPLLLSPIDFNVVYAEKANQAQTQAPSPEQAAH